MRRGPIVALSVFMVMAGCFGGSSDRSPGSLQRDIGADAGSIIGLVLDDQQLPVPGAVAVLDGDARTETGANGTFIFDGVEPGRHTVSVGKSGFQDKTAEVDVVRDARAEVQIQLFPIGVDEPFHQTYTFNGLVGCNVNALGEWATWAWLTCEAFFIAGASSVDNYIGVYPEVPLEDSTGYWAETQWDSTQAFGRAMMVRWAFCLECLPAQNTYAVTSYYDSEGVSPLRQRVDIDTVNQYIAENDVTMCDPEACWLISLQYAGTDGPAGAPVGVMMQQRFEQFLTMFYHGPLPDEFTVMPDQ